MEIYLIINQINGKQYIGQTRTTTAIRWKTHCRNAAPQADTIVDRAIWKYGPDKFTVKCLWWGTSHMRMNELEVRCIRLFQTRVPAGYNLKLGGSHHPVTRSTMSRAHKGRPLTLEHRAKMSRARGGRPIVIDGVQYISTRDAAQKLGIPKSTADRRANPERVRAAARARYARQERIIKSRVV